MKFIVICIFLCLFSCSYPDIDSVPIFNDISLTEEELFDLSELPSADKSNNK